MPAILDRKYEKFLAGPTQPPETRVHVTMDTRGVLTLNATCYRMIGKPVAANLFFSRADDTIALEPVDSPRFNTAFPFRENSSARYVNAAPFCRHFGIKLDATQKFLSPEYRDGALHLKLAETVTVKRVRRMKKKA
ncbi:MAG: hypothetical protein LC730_02655 [Acidobacteria bacterium]|nr:hypothetical protein [Acidobacteriota bacterium]MCA1608344.1 hypothetical protein [Acidobacteriota bacterium]